MTLEHRCQQSLRRKVTDCIPIKSMDDAYRLGLSGARNPYKRHEPECLAFIEGYAAGARLRNEKARRWHER